MSINTRSPAAAHGVHSAFFDRAEQIVGKDNISRDPSYGALAGIRDSKVYEDAFPMGRDHTPSGAVRPATLAELREVVILANETETPLWTFSRGKNLGCLIP